MRRCLVSDDKKKTGRPTKYNQAIDEEICLRLANGESLNAICRDKHMPDRCNVMRWILATTNSTYDAFRTNYTLAREIQYQNMSDDILDIADDGTNDWMETNNPGSDGYQVNGEALGRSRLRVDTRKWFMSKVLPKFKDKQQEIQTVIHNIMPVPVADSAESWEEASKATHDKNFGNHDE